MTQFSNKFKKTLFLAHFPHLWGKKNFFQKIWLCHSQLHMGFQHHAKIQSKLMTQFKENDRTDTQKDGQKDKRIEGRTDPILQDPSGYGWRSNKKQAFINNNFSYTRLRACKTILGAHPCMWETMHVKSRHASY